MRTLLLAAACSLAFVTDAAAQGQYGPSRGFRAQTAMTALGQYDVVRRNQGAQQASYRAAARIGGPTANRQAGVIKPFSSATTGTAISPYLNLFRAEDENAAPNYFAFVRPQLQQEEANRQQQAQLQQLQRQVQQANYTTPAASVAGGARYGDTGRFYSGWRR